MSQTKIHDIRIQTGMYQAHNIRTGMAQEAAGDKEKERILDNDRSGESYRIQRTPKLCDYLPEIVLRKVGESMMGTLSDEEKE